jgi:hypothetical protein
MSFETRIRKQNAVYFRRTGSLDSFGNDTFEEGIAVKVRWNNTKNTVRTDKGETVETNHKVFVGQEMFEGDWLCLGSVSDMTSLTNPSENAGAKPIRKLTSSPDLKVRFYIRKAFL